MANKTARIELLVQPDEKTSWQAQAEKEGMSLSCWIRIQLNTALFEKGLGK